MSNTILRLRPLEYAHVLDLVRMLTNKYIQSFLYFYHQIFCSCFDFLLIYVQSLNDFPFLPKLEKIQAPALDMIDNLNRSMTDQSMTD